VCHSSLGGRWGKVMAKSFWIYGTSPFSSVSQNIISISIMNHKPNIVKVYFFVFPRKEKCFVWCLYVHRSIQCISPSAVT
jgi:hypothetical protein